MGMLDKAKDALGIDDKADQASDKAKQMQDKAKATVDKAGDAVDDKTGGKHSGHVDKAQDMTKDAIDKMNKK
ncbi:antitoxin [Catellatospora sichuanensis]|uniref:antitoxin n=1 Tax=Catellatospora sichuanensis TaxID=1969805 RepID=UPI0011830831|nr:antitoxin [Catellatospora sichuanensis]